MTHRGKRGEALIEVSRRLSVLSWSVVFFHPAARNLPAPLRTSVFEGSANEKRPNVAIKHRPA